MVQAAFPASVHFQSQSAAHPASLGSGPHASSQPVATPAPRARGQVCSPAGRGRAGASAPQVPAVTVRPASAGPGVPATRGRSPGSAKCPVDAASLTPASCPGACAHLNPLPSGETEARARVPPSCGRFQNFPPLRNAAGGLSGTCAPAGRSRALALPARAPAPRGGSPPCPPARSPPARGDPPTRRAARMRAAHLSIPAGLPAAAGAWRPEPLGRQRRLSAERAGHQPKVTQQRREAGGGGGLGFPARTRRRPPPVSPRPRPARHSQPVLPMSSRISSDADWAAPMVPTRGLRGARPSQAPGGVGGAAAGPASGSRRVGTPGPV